MKKIHYQEKITSSRTSALFILLTILFLSLFFWRINRVGFTVWTVVWGMMAVVFGFYVINYRSLEIQLNEDSIRLRFGLITWTETLKNIQGCFQDTTSMWRIGGAGIHFSPIQGRYRAMFNFLEFPRIVLQLRNRRGLVRDLAFSTQHPQQIINLIQKLIAA